MLPVLVPPVAKVSLAQPVRVTLASFDLEFSSVELELRMCRSSRYVDCLIQIWLNQVHFTSQNRYVRLCSPAPRKSGHSRMISGSESDPDHGKHFDPRSHLQKVAY